MTPTREPDAAAVTAAGQAWTDPTALALLPGASQPDDVDAELLRLAQAVRALRDVTGPTFSLQEVSAFVRWLVREAKALTPAQRHKAADYVRQGMGLADALTVAVLVCPGSDQ